MSRRKTLLANELPVFEDEVVDDEAEKRKRMSIRFENPPSGRLHRRLETDSPQINGNGTAAAQNKRLSIFNANQQPKPSNEQLSCLYNNCVKLLNENKINAKNAFQLKLIDYMSDIVLNKEIVGGVTNFQVVGCTIDAGTKIYAARVDALHHNTYQMLSGLGQQANEEDSQEGQANGDGTQNGDLNADDGEDNDENQANKKTKNKRRRLKKSSQIAENLDTITSKLRDEFVDEDLYFGKISSCIEHEGISGILLNKLHIADDSLKMLINPDDKMDILTNEHEDKYEIKSGHEMNVKDIYDNCKSKGIDLRNIKLCADLNNFKFIGWDSNDEISKLVESMVAQEDDLEIHRFDANNIHSIALNEQSHVDNMDLMLDDDDVAGTMSIMDGQDLAGELVSTNRSAMQMFDKIDDLRTISTVAELTNLIVHQPSDYSYFNFEKLRLHDLPKHLKTIAARLAAANGEAGQAANVAVPTFAAAKNARNKKEAPLIDLGIKTDRMKFFKLTKKAIFLCDKTIEKRSEKPCRIETERQYDYNARELLQPYFKNIPAKIFSDIEPVENLLVSEETAPPRLNQNNLEDDDHLIGGLDDDFEIPCTAQSNEPFFTQNGGEFIQSEGGNDMMMHMPELDHLNESINLTGGLVPLPYDGDNLVQVPLQVNALNIEYAKTSKNIDVRRLKHVMWNLICSNNDKENIDNSVNTSKSLLMNNSNLHINVSLKNIYNQLKPPIISKRVYEDLSICIVFQMLLFLANEHGLILTNDHIGSDVIITNVI